LVNELLWLVKRNSRGPRRDVENGEAKSAVLYETGERKRNDNTKTNPKDSDY